MSLRTRLLVVCVSAVLFFTTLPRVSVAIHPVLTLPKATFVVTNLPGRNNSSVSVSKILAPVSTTLWYTGDSAGTNALPNDVNFSGSNGLIFSDFNVTDPGPINGSEYVIESQAPRQGSGAQCFFVSKFQRAPSEKGRTRGIAILERPDERDDNGTGQLGGPGEKWKGIMKPQ